MRRQHIYEGLHCACARLRSQQWLMTHRGLSCYTMALLSIFIGGVTGQGNQTLSWRHLSTKYHWISWRQGCFPVKPRDEQARIAICHLAGQLLNASDFSYRHSFMQSFDTLACHVNSFASHVHTLNELVDAFDRHECCRRRRRIPVYAGLSAITCRTPAARKPAEEVVLGPNFIAHASRSLPSTSLRPYDCTTQMHARTYFCVVSARLPPSWLSWPGRGQGRRGGRGQRRGQARLDRLFSASARRLVFFLLLPFPFLHVDCFWSCAYLHPSSRGQLHRACA